MKRLSVLLSLCLLPLLSQAAPFVFADVSAASAEKCVVTGATLAALNGEYPVAVDAVYGRGCKIDVATVAVGSNSLSVAVASDLWGVLGSAVPFSFSRPAATLAVDGIRLVK